MKTLRSLSPRFRLTLILVAAGSAGLGGALAPRSGVNASVTAQVAGAGVRLVYLCADPTARCSVPEEFGRAITDHLPIEASGVLGLTGFDPIYLSGFPATLVLSDGKPVGAIVGSRADDILREELGALAAAAAAGRLPTRESLLRSQVVATPAGNAALLLELRYEGGRFVVEGVSQISGQAPARERDSLESYIVQVRDAQGQVIESRPWQLNRFVSPPPPRPGQDPGGMVERTAFETAIVLPLYAEAASVQILEPYGVERLSIAVGAPEMRVARDANSKLGATGVYITGPDSERFTVLFLGDKYDNDDATFASDVDIHAGKFLATKPIKSKKNRNNINIYRGDLGKRLKCKYGCLGIDRLICCNDAKVFAAAAKSGVAYDEIVVLLNKAKYGGSGGTYAVAYNRSGKNKWGPEVTVHEAGHSMFGLMDEYEYGINGVPFGPNCSLPPCTWKGKGLGCWDGCSYLGLARPTDEHCLMRTLTPAQGRYDFCKVGKREVSRVIKSY